MWFILISAILAIAIFFERVFHYHRAQIHTNDFVKGIAATLKQFEKILTDIGVEKIKTVGAAFDPRYHEAISMEEGDGRHEMVSEELQAGYKIGDEVIRHAMVKVRME